MANESDLLSPHHEQKQQEKKKLLIQLQKYDATQRQFPSGELMVDKPAQKPRIKPKYFKINLHESLLQQSLPLKSTSLPLQVDIGVVSKGKKSPSHIQFALDALAFTELAFYSCHLDVHYKIFRQGQLQILVKHYQTVVRVFLVPFNLTSLSIGRHILRQSCFVQGVAKSSIIIPLVVRLKSQTQSKRLSVPEGSRKLSVGDDKEYFVDGKMRIVFSQMVPEDELETVNEVI